MNRVEEEAVLRRAVLAGDEAAWRVIYDSHFGWLYCHVLARAGGNRDVARDLVQEVWLVAVRRIRDFEPARAPLRAWLKGIAGNVLRNYYRKRGAPVPNRGDSQEQSSDDAGKPANGEAIELALAALSNGHRKALLARYQEERSVEEVAEQLDLTYKAAESLLSRARAAFRQAYNELEES